jgi:hypothetical protein
MRCSLKLRKVCDLLTSHKNKYLLFSFFFHWSELKTTLITFLSFEELSFFFSLGSMVKYYRTLLYIFVKQGKFSFFTSLVVSILLWPLFFLIYF